MSIHPQQQAHNSTQQHTTARTTSATRVPPEANNDGRLHHLRTYLMVQSSVATGGTNQVGVAGTNAAGSGRHKARTIAIPKRTATGFFRAFFVVDDGGCFGRTKKGFGWKEKKRREETERRTKNTHHQQHCQSQSNRIHEKQQQQQQRRSVLYLWHVVCWRISLRGEQCHER